MEIGHCIQAISSTSCFLFQLRSVMSMSRIFRLMEPKSVGIALEVENGLLELGAHGAHGFECVVLEDFFADFIPEIFFRIELRRIGRKIQELDVARVFRSPHRSRAFENQQDVFAERPCARQHLEEGLEACRIRGRHDQIDASAVLGRDRAVEIDVLADQLPRRPRVACRPAPSRAGCGSCRRSALHRQT